MRVIVRVRIRVGGEVGGLPNPNPEWQKYHQRTQLGFFTQTSNANSASLSSANDVRNHPAPRKGGVSGPRAKAR